MAIYKTITCCMMICCSVHLNAQQTTTTRSNPKTVTNNSKAVIVPVSKQALINLKYDSLEKAIELQYAKFISEAKKNKSQLEDKIKQCDKRIEDLKEKAKQFSLAMANPRITKTKYENYKDSVIYCDKQINSEKDKKSIYKSQIQEIDKQISQLEIEKQKQLADLRKQRQKELSN